MVDFERIALKLIQSSNRKIAEKDDEFHRLCPGIARQIETDRGSSGPAIFWGESRNVDEFAGQVIVEPSILQTIFRIADRRLMPEHPHAGYQHTYGYLFSLIKTPYGKKRDRWTRTDLEASLGLPLDLLGPSPSEGTLMANVTWLAGNIAFSGHNRVRWLHRCLSKRAALAVQVLDLKVWRHLRLTETVAPANSNSLRSAVSLITDLVQMPFAKKFGIKENWLLVYSIRTHAGETPKLVTLFTVTDDFVDSIHARAGRRNRTDVRPRYNASVPGLTNEPQAGTVLLKVRSD